VSPSSSSTLAVDVTGAVRNPTLYYLPAGSRLQQAIHAAGGPTKDADLDQVNLAEPVSDGEKVYIPHKGATFAEAMSYSPSTSSGEPVETSRRHRSYPAETIEPLPPLPVSVPRYVAVTPGNSIGLTSPPPPSTAPSDIIAEKPKSHGRTSSKFRSPADGQVDLNTATEEDLEKIPGIGPAMAGRILAYRQQIGQFHSIDDLRQVSGVGDKKIAKWAPYFVIR
jgi:competence protein ComEA